MSLHFGPGLLAIPGPSVIPERVLNAMHRPSPNIYEGELVDMTATLFPDLKAVARTSGQAAIYISNGHGAWEAALRNTVNPGEKILVIVTGRFGEGWGILANSLGIETEYLDFGNQSAADPGRIADILRADRDRAIRAVTTVQTDTATSVRNDIAAIRGAMDDAGHPALLMVDCIASLGCDRFEMDDWGVDVTVAACQKGLMTPAGMSFVFLNERAKEISRGTRPGAYFDWAPRIDPEYFYQQFCGTAPTHHLFGLRAALDLLVHEEGVEACWRRHKILASAYRAAINTWGKGGEISLNITDPQIQSNAVTTVRTGIGDAVRLRQWCESSGGLTLGIGLGMGDVGSEGYNRHFRIGHMGHQNIPMVLAVIGTIDCGLKALGIAHGDGAVEAATRLLATHGSSA